MADKPLSSYAGTVMQIAGNLIGARHSVPTDGDVEIAVRVEACWANHTSFDTAGLSSSSGTCSSVSRTMAQPRAQYS